MPHALPLVARELALGIRAPHEVAADALHVLVADALELSNGVGTVGLGVSKCLGDAFDERAALKVRDPWPRRPSLRVARNYFVKRKGSLARRRRRRLVGNRGGR
jgi:hypothetical protein